MDRETEDTLVSKGLPCSAASSPTTADLTKAANMLVRQAIEQAVSKCEKQKSEAPAAADSASRAKKPPPRSFFKKLALGFQSTFRRKKSKKVKVRASSKHDLGSTLLGDSIKTEMRNLRSPTSYSSFHHVAAQTESQPLAETATDCQEEARSRKSTDSRDGVLRAAADIKGEVYPDLADSCSQAFQKTFSPTAMAQMIKVLPTEGQGEYDNTEAGEQTTAKTAFPPGPSEEDGHAVFSQEENAGAAHWRQVLNSSTMSAHIRRFFLRLSEEQWREVSEGVYNADVKEQLTVMCTDVLTFISEAVINVTLQKLCATSDTFTLSPLALERLMEGFNANIQISLESSFGHALRDTNGVHIPVTVAPEFSDAIAAEVSYAVSEAIQVSLDGGSSGATGPASYQESHRRAAERTLAGAIDTLKSFVTGRGTAVQKRIRMETCFDEEAAAGVKKTEKESWWRSCFCGACKSASTDSISVKQPSPSPRETSSTPSSSDVPNAGLWPTPLALEYHREVEDMTPNETRNVGSLEEEFLEDPPVAEDVTDEDQHEMSASSSSSLSRSKDPQKRKSFFLFCNMFSKDVKKRSARTRLLCGCSCGAAVYH